MTRDQLEHAIRAACDLSGDSELWVFGSQALLGQYPDAPASLRASVEVDLQPKNRPQQVDVIDGALGEMSQFHQTFGFYVHGVSIESANLPPGWKDRVLPVSDPLTTRGNTGWCVEAHDLAASKLAAFREKDREFVRTLLAEGMIEADVLAVRIVSMKLAAEERERLSKWVNRTATELGDG